MPSAKRPRRARSGQPDRCSSRALAAALALGALSLACPLLVACEEPKPDRLALDPTGPFSFEKRGEHEQVKAAAFRGPRPYVKPVPVEFASADTTVATVDPDGTIRATGSGTTTITASAWGLSTTAEVKVRIVGSIALADDVPKPYKMNAKPRALKAVVKDDKGVVIEGYKVAWRATDYCVEVDDEGVIKPLSDGDCDIEARAADQYARIKLQVRE